MKTQFTRPLKTVGLGLLGIGFGLGCLKASTVIAQALPNWSGSPLYGEVELWSGFEPDPYLVDVVAGGETDAASLDLGWGCTGFIAADQPDFRVHYEAGDYPLSFFVESAADTTLVINAPDSQWYCNDDFDGTNPLVMFDYPESGQYDIWIGHFGDGSTYEATLEITEYDLTGY